ncbi:hypothetical protein M0R88_01725 [Halorussus gelatinilyticus]|uniref:Uncharacterized protein n=1 Tax=Halorussus gelatinilyticus TaxID=2937524 RepID=A0A8U0IJG4_9EURY|nr:hypothetical protein [Halorussus gelatinilyticus]UPW00836.1 hypothetical protein M0R88_01725 [Halorussus gelatinilyticus]
MPVAHLLVETLVPLQLTPPDVPGWVRSVSQAMNLVAALVGLLIAYQAFRGYRRNDSRPMLFIAVGFALTVGLPFVLLGPMLLFGNNSAAVTAFVLVSNGSTLVGLGCILYALRMPS